MWKATVKGIAAHRVRLVLSLVAVMLGVTFVTGTYVLTDTLDRSYDGLFTQTVANVDIVVRLPGEEGPAGTGERFSDRLLDPVQAVPGVEDAYGVVFGYAQFVGRDGEAIRPAGRADRRALVGPARRERSAPARRAEEQSAERSRRSRDGRRHRAGERVRGG